MKKTGWIGLGKMGIPMASGLIKAGVPVTVYNRSKEKERTIVSMGASACLSPARLLEQSDLVIIMISDDAAVRDIFLGESGLLSAKASGKMIINMSTVSPTVSKEMAAICRQQGNGYIDAPVSGSVKQAETAQLVIMAGGEEDDIEQVRPILEIIGKLVIRMGGIGSGNAAKLAVNTLLGFYTQGLAEAVILGEKNGIKTADLLAIINNAAIGNLFTKIKGDAILAENFTAAFALKHIVKDIGLAKDAGLATPMGNAMYNTFRNALPLFGEEDLIAVIRYLRANG